MKAQNSFYFFFYMTKIFRTKLAPPYLFLLATNRNWRYLKAAMLHESFLNVPNNYYLKTDKEIGTQTDFPIMFKETLPWLNLFGLTATGHIFLSSHHSPARHHWTLPLWLLENSEVLHDFQTTNCTLAILLNSGCDIWQKCITGKDLC